MKPLAIPVLLLAAGLASASPARAAEGALTVTTPAGEPVPMPLVHTEVSIEVSAFVARTTVEQVFENPFDDPVEAVYTFPLGATAAVDDFTLTVGDRTIRGEIERREEARATYESARARGLQAALLEQERPNVFTQSVANLEPGKPVTVRLRTVEKLRYERGWYRLLFPLVVAPRYAPAGAVPDAKKVSAPILPPGTRSGHDVAITVTIDAGVPISKIESPSHRIVVERPSPRTARVHLAKDDTIPNKDFMLRWDVASDRPAVGFLAHRDGLDGFFTLLVQPKGAVTTLEAAPKEITFVVDTSGSMSGTPIEASKRFVAKALHALGPRDTFNLIRFAGDNEVFRKDPLPNDDGDVDAAIAWLSAQRGGGGTEMLAALRAAFARPEDPNRLRVVVFLTDGEVGDDDRILAEIAKVLGDARIDTVGIGTSVNHSLLSRMADLGRGGYVYVRPDDTADDALEAFRSWVTKPYLTDLSIDWGALPVADLAPERIPDLGSGQTLTLVGRYLSAGEGDVTVRGKLGGAYWEQTVHVVLPERETRHDALASLWARGRIEGLLRAAPGGVTDSIRAEATALALEYRLMSPFTSFVAVDESRVVNPAGTPRRIRQAVPLAEGMSYEKIFGTAGPPALVAKANTSAPEDEGESEATEVRSQTFVTEVAGIPGGAVGGPLTAAAMAPAPPPRAEARARLVRSLARASVVDRDRASVAPRFSGEFITDLPIAGRFYQNVLKLAPGVVDPEGDGSPFVESPSARDHLADVAFRVLADLAEDGKLSPAEGRPSLAALLGAERPSGAISSDTATQAVATWALAEAAAATHDPWVVKASAKALDYLVGLKGADGWPARPDGAANADATRWARLVVGAKRPEAVATAAVPAGPAAAAYRTLRRAIAAARTGAKPPAPSGRTPFDRLIAAIRRGHLKVVRS